MDFHTLRCMAILMIKAVLETVAGICTAPIKNCAGRRKKKYTEAHYEDTDFNRYILEKCPALCEYKPSPWAPGPSSQTVFSVFVPAQEIKYLRELVPMKDRVKVALDWCPADQANYPEDSPVVLCLHGIGCSSQGKSVRLLMEECLKRGWRGVVYNRRGHGGTSIAPESDEDDDNSSSDIGMDSSLDDSCTSKDEPGRALAKMFPEHADVDDMADVVRHIARKHPAARIVCVGFSLGSNLLLRYLGHMRERSGIFAGVSIANGFDLVQGTRNLKERSPVMDAIVVSKLKRLVRANSEHIIRAQRLEDQHLQGLMRARSVRDFDDVIAKPLYGYESVDEYYEQSSCVAMLKDICSPVLCITDQDDPLISSDLLKHPLDAGRVNHNLLTVLTRTGGHLGWLEGWKGKSWVIKACGQYIEAVLAEECPLP